MIKLQPNKKFPVTNTQFFGCSITLTLASPSEGSLHNPNSDSTNGSPLLCGDSRAAGRGLTQMQTPLSAFPAGPQGYTNRQLPHCPAGKLNGPSTFRSVMDIHIT